MKIEDLTPRQLAKLQEAKAEVMRAGFLNRKCTDQQFLDAVAVHRRTREMFEMLGSALQSANPKFKTMTNAFEVFAEVAEHLWDTDGVWDAKGWRQS
ncbi:MAG: hypothetical protein V3U11_11540 [Planctomycetota bacterium]